MFIGILYIFSFLVFLVTAILFKKDNKKHNIVLWSVISLFLTFIINSLLVFIPSLFNIASPLWLRSILFLGLSSPMLYKIIKKKEIQKYEICWKDYVILGFSLILVTCIGTWRFNNFNLRFETSDPAVHYFDAEVFSKSNKLMEKSPDDTLYHFNTGKSMFLSYTSVGTMMQVNNDFDWGIRGNTRCFILFELMILLCTTIMLIYTIVDNISEVSIFKLIFVAILTTLCILGYPFNNLIFGFHYLGLSILIGLIFLYLMKDGFKNKPTGINMIIIALFAFSIFTTYYMFVPIYFGAAGLYILYLWKFNNEFDFKTAARYIGLVLVIPFMVGMFYYFISNYLFAGSSISSSVSIFKAEGYIYRSLIGNFVLVLPIVLYKMVLELKEKKISIFSFSILFTLLYIVILLYFFYIGEIASYYYYKLYYVLWLVSFVIMGRALCEKKSQINGYAITNTIVLLLLFIFQIYNVDNFLYNRNPLMNNVPFSNGIENIYWFNWDRNDKKIHAPIYTNKELENLDKLYNKYGKDMKKELTVYYGELFQRLWLYSYTGINPLGADVRLGRFYEDMISEEEVNENKIKYLLCNNNKKAIESCMIDGSELEYKNDSFILYKKTDK